MIKLCIFDLDGTVLDSVATIAHYANLALSQHGIEPIETERYRYLAGRGIERLLRGALAEREREGDEALYRSVYRTYDDAYNANPSHQTRIFDGMKETLDALKERGIKLAVVSNKPDFAAKGVINELYGEGYFDFVTGAVDAYPLKPDPKSTLAVVRRFGVDRGEVLYIGDTATDIETAKNAAITAVGVLWGFREKEELLSAGAEHIVGSPCELLDLL